MWIEFNINGREGLLNSNGVCLIRPAPPHVQIDFTHGNLVIIDAKGIEDARAIVFGFNTALNGQDFVYGQGGYIRPMHKDKQTRLYEYMLYQDFLGDRRK